MASVRIESPRFPQAYEIHGVPPGDYYVLAIIDSFENDGHRYHPNVDPGGAYGRYEAPSSVELRTVNQLESIDIELVDPSDSSPWARQGYE